MTIDIGYQSVTSQTWGALIIKHQHLFESRLRSLFPHHAVQIVWHNELSGAIVNSNILAGKYELGFMGDMPCLLNAYKGAASPLYHSRLIALDGKGAQGQNQGIVVRNRSSIHSVRDLKGRTVSVPIGSSAHRMLLSILAKYHVLHSVTIVHQDVSVAVNALESGRVDAFAGWDPYPRYLVSRGNAHVLADGKKSGVDYLTGIMVNKDWAAANRTIVVAFLESLLDAHRLINNHPAQAALIFQQESGFPLSITTQEVKNIRWDSVLYRRDVATLSGDLHFLTSIKALNQFNLNTSIDTSYLTTAIKDERLATPNINAPTWPELRY